MRALRGTGSFAQRGDVLGCNCRCLHDGSWPLRHRREKGIGRGEDDDDLEQRHPCNCNTITTGDEAMHCKLDTLATTCSSGGGATSSSGRAATPADVCDACESQERDGTRITLACTHTSGGKKKGRDGGRLQRCERSDGAEQKYRNSYERAPNEQEPRAPRHRFSPHRLKK